MFPAMKKIKTRIDGSVVYTAIDNPPLNLLGAGFVTDPINLLNTLRKREPSPLFARQDRYTR